MSSGDCNGCLPSILSGVGLKLSAKGLALLQSNRKSCHWLWIIYMCLRDYSFCINLISIFFLVSYPCFCIHMLASFLDPNAPRTINSSLDEPSSGGTKIRSESSSSEGSTASVSSSSASSESGKSRTITPSTCEAESSEKTSDKQNVDSEVKEDASTCHHCKQIVPIRLSKR